MSKIEFDYRSCDREIWEEELDDFVPDRILDAHIHLFWKSCLDNVKPRFPGGDANIQTLNKWAEVLYPGRKMQYLILGTDVAKHTDAVRQDIEGIPGVRVWGSDRVRRGSSWGPDARSCRSANRRRFIPSYRFIILGFRVVLIPLAAAGGAR